MNILNITDADYEETIKKSIQEVTEEYHGLMREQTCKIYSSMINEKLKQNHLISRTVSTTDLGSSYEHRFVVAKDQEDYYVVDLTYSQLFQEVPEEFKPLDKEGYQKVDKAGLSSYLETVSKEPITITSDTVFFK